MRPSTRTTSTLLVFTVALATVFWIAVRTGSDTPTPGYSVAQSDTSVKDPQNPVESAVLETVDFIPLHDFSTWMESFRTGERSEAFIEQGVVLAKQRRGSMLRLMRQNAKAALGAAISYADYAALPEELRFLVEEPFTSTGDVGVLAVCDHDPNTPEYRVHISFEDGERFHLGNHEEMRTGLSKLDVPLQGIRLDEWAAVEPTVFDVVDGADEGWAWDTLPSGNPDPELDFFTGEELGPNAITAVAGGFSFRFSDEATLTQLEEELRVFDNMSGRDTGSSVIFSELVQSEAKGFPILLIRESQKQLSINNTTGAKTALFIRAVFSDKPDAPISKADLESQINTSVSGHLSNFSYGKTSMTATVSDSIYQVSMVSTEYAFTGPGDTVDEKTLWDEAVALWRADGDRPDPYGTYDIVGVVFPKIDGVGWAGLGTVGGANSQHWLNGVASTETILHEFGHNYGLGHSNYWAFDSSNAASTDPVDTSGANEEYGDFWDVMGDGDANRGHFHMAAKRYLSWLDGNQVQRIDEAGDSGTYQVFRFDHKDATGLQGLEIRKDGDENYWVGFRRAFESNANYYSGGYILWERPSTGTDRNQGWIIDTTPGSESERQDAGIALGRTYSDAAALVHITPITVGGSSPDEYLDVVVNYGAFPGNNAPTVTLNAPSTGDARNPVVLSASGDDTDGDTLAYSWDLGNGEVYSSTDSISATFTVGGTFNVSVTVTDMKGGTMTQSAQIVIDDPVNTWTTRTSGTGADLVATARNSSHVVAAGHGVFLRSSDGSTWTNHTPSGQVNNVTINAITWTGSEFIAVGQDFDFDIGDWATVIFTSPDGETWTKDFSAQVVAGGSSLQSTGLNGVASNPDGSQVVTVGDAGMIYKRIDGGDWTLVDLGMSNNTLLGGIAYGGGVFVLGGYQFGAGSGLALFNTLDTVNWANLKDNSDLMHWYGLDEIAFFSDFFIGSGFFSRTVFSENSGVSWQSLQQGNTHEINAFAFGNGVYYAIGEDKDNANALVNLVSNNGKIWKEVDSGVAENGNDVIFFNNSFIIVNDGGSIRQSGLVNAADEVLAAPVISPAGQEFSDSIDVTITTNTQSAEIRYTRDGSEPTVGSTLYGSAINLTDTTTVKAKVFKGELDSSPTASETYTKGVEVLAVPIISPATQEFFDAISVTITTNAANAEIRYTLDDAEPTSGSTLYSGAINITETTTIKAKVFKAGLDPSPTATETYTKGVLTGFALWINTFFQGADAEGSANPDGDWASNLFEWFLGSSPDDVDSVPDAPEFSFSQSQQAVFTIPRFSKSADVFLVVEKSPDLENWQVMTTSATTDSDTLLVLVTDDPILFVPCFLRIKAEEM